MTTLSEQLALQAAYVEQLQELLTEEKSALEQRDVQTLERISQDKQAKVSQIASMDGQILQTGAALELTAEQQQQKQQIQLQLTQCQQLNDVNGKLIELNLRNAKRLADIIVRSRSRNNVTYDKLGRTRGSFSSLGMSFKS